MRGYYDTESDYPHGGNAMGGLLPHATVNVERDSVESFWPGAPYSVVRVFDHALTSDEVRREYETQRVTVNKTTHRIRFENETESSVDVVIEEKRGSQNEG